MRVGIIGMGGMGWAHARRICGLEGVRLAAMADKRPDALAAHDSLTVQRDGTEVTIGLEHVNRFSDGLQMIADADLDVVDICLPTHLHADVSVQALQAGCHVLCEKPMALRIEDAERMIVAARTAERTLMVAQCVRFWPEYQFLRRCVRDERFGRLLSLNLRRTSGRPTGGTRSWFLDVNRSGGLIFDLHVHDVDFVQYLLGEPDDIMVVGRRSGATGGWDIVHAVYDYVGGPQVHIHAGWSAARVPFEAGFDAWFERGFVRYCGTQTPTLSIYDERGPVAGGELETGDAYEQEIAYFLSCVETGQRPLECLPESTRDSVGLLLDELAALK